MSRDTHAIRDLMDVIFDAPSNGNNTSNIQHRIFKVHNRLRRRHKEAYEPECLSIGPYHRGKDHLQDMETHKRRFLYELLDRPEASTRESYTAALSEVEEQARRFYTGKISLSKDDFVEMMLLDGCFIIGFLRKWHNSLPRVQEDSIIFNTPWLLEALLMDLILLENQVPFFILLKLFDMTMFLHERQQDLVQMAKILTLLAPNYPYIRPNYAAPNADQVIHLLDLVYKSCSSSFSAELTSAADDAYNDAYDDALIDCIKSTSELEESGVKFEKASENGAAWLGITWENGVMKIPQFSVSVHTECILRNLIAYEQCYLGNSQRRYITDYVTVMDLLINSPVDVEKLRHHQIIKNWLGDDEAVSTMFNKLAKDVILIPKLFCYRVVLTKVNKFSSKRTNKWRANLMRNYFNTPWSIISFLAAAVLLILTFLQTEYAILSTNKH